jgi:hypothetical protein
MEQRNIADKIIDLLYECENKSKKKKGKLNQYYKKQLTKRRNKKLCVFWWAVSYDKETDRYKRYYYSGRKKYAKYCTNRKVRKTNDFPLKDAGYRKCFDYWWTVF